MSDAMTDRFIGLAQWIAVLRGTVGRNQYTRMVMHKPVAEIGTRLAQQLAKLAMGVAMLHNRNKIGEYEYRIAAHVARDTAPDRVEEIIHQLFLQKGDDFASTTDLIRWTRFPRNTILQVLQDMNMLRILQTKRGSRGVGLWRIAQPVIELMEPLNIYQKGNPEDDDKLILPSRGIIRKRKPTRKIIRARR